MIEMPKSRTFLGALNGFQYTWFECDEVADTSVRLEGAMSIFMASPETYGCRIGKTGKVYCLSSIVSRILGGWNEAALEYAYSVRSTAGV